MREKTLEGSRAFVERVPFDQVTGAIHFMDDLDLYYPDFYQDKDKETAYRRYFQDMAENLHTHSFVDVLAHIDYVARYAPYDNPELDYGSFRQEIDEVLKTVIETNTVLELNTRRLGDSLALKELVPIYARYKELGGRFITLGSDAHKHEDIGAHFGAAREMAAALGLTVVTFCERQMDICK